MRMRRRQGEHPAREMWLAGGWTGRTFGVNFRPPQRSSMLKHTDITVRRIEQFVKNELLPHIFFDRTPLKIEFSDCEYPDQATAQRGEWQEVRSGFQYGPAYATKWFRISGTVPDRLKGLPLVVFAEVGGERTVWRDNSPFCGIDVEHSDFGWIDGNSVTPLNSVPTQDGDLLLYIQTYARNPQCRVHGRELPREELVERVQGAELAGVDTDLKALYFDCEFARLLMGTLEASDPSHATILRALNDVVNTFTRDDRDTIRRCRKTLRDALGSLSGEIAHTITAVGHAHLDTAWLWPIDITKKKMAHTTANQLMLMERYPEHVFAHSQASQYEWLEKEYPVLFERVKEAIARGQWEPVGSMWVEADCNLTGAESLVRQFLYGRRYFRDKLGFETHDMWLPDVFGYSAALPQILAKSNIQFFLTQKMSWSQFNKFPHHTFWWQGIDGTRVWTHFPPADTYNGNCEPKEVLHSVRNYRDHGRCDQSLYLYGFGDGGGGPTERHLEFLRRGRMAPNYPEIQRQKGAIDFFREAKARSGDLMTWAGELYLEYHRGTYTSQAANKRNNRMSEFLLRDAELLSCFHPDFPNRYPAEDLEAAWKLVLLNQFHDIIPGSSVREVYEDSDRDYAEVLEVGSRIVRENLEAIGSRFDTSSMARPVALFQNAEVPTQGEIPWEEEAVPAGLALAEESVPVQLVEEFGERKLIFPTPAAALGTVAVADLGDGPVAGRTRLKASGSARRLENSEFSIRFDPNGNIVSIESLEDGTEFVEPGKLANLFQLFEDKPMFWSAWDIDAFAYEKGQDLVKSDSFEIVERGPVRVAAEVVKRFGNSRIRQRISLGPTPGIRFDTEIDWHEEDKLLKVAFPVHVNASRATYEIQFGNVERPTHMNTSWDVARFEVCAQKWVDLSEGDQGVALLNDGKYGHDVQGNVIRMSLLRAPKAPDPECDMGLHRFSYVLMPHFGSYHHAGVVQAAYALNAPVRHAFLQPSAGEQGTLPPFVACDGRNVVIESVKRAEDGDGVIVRLYECHNSRGIAELSCAVPPKSACLCDLEENDSADLEVVEGVVPFSYKPFEIVTFRLRF
jgi:alpha-mannosidase